MLVSLLIALASGVQAAPAPPPSNQVVVDGQKPEEKQICRRETPLGSIHTIRVCMTKKEWAQRTNDSDGEGDLDRIRIRAQRSLGSMNQ